MSDRPDAREIIADVIYEWVNRHDAEATTEAVIDALASHGWLLVRLADGPAVKDCTRDRVQS